MRSLQQQLGVLGTISAFAYRQTQGNQENLCRGGGSQDLRDSDLQPAVRRLQCIDNVIKENSYLQFTYIRYLHESDKSRLSSRAFIENPVKILPAFQGNRKFITVFSAAPIWTLFLARRFQSSPSRILYKMIFNIFLPFAVCCPELSLFFLVFLLTIPLHCLPTLYTLYCSY